MKALAFSTLLFLINLVMSAETLGTVFSGKDFVDLFDILGDSVAYVKNSTVVYKGGNFDTKLDNITDIRCSSSNNICIVGTDFVFNTVAIDASGNNITRTMIYLVRSQTLFRIHSRIAFIEGTDYFLTASLSKFGVNRWRIGHNESFSQLKIQGLGGSLEIADILIVDRSNYALISFSGYSSITLIDFVAMTETRTIKGTAGQLALLTADPSQAFFMSASEKRLTKYSYLDGTAVGSLEIDYIVTGMKNVKHTDFVIVATWEQVFVYSFSGSDTAVWAASPYYYYMAGKQMPGGVRFSQSTATMYFAGLGHVSSLTDTVSSYCHPNCNGCSLMLSEYKCSACKSTATSDNGACKSSSIKDPPGGVVNFENAKWSDDNMKPAPSKKFNIKDYYLYIIIGAGGLVALCCIYCICRMCCKKNEDEQQQQGNNPNRVQPKQDY